MWTAPKSPEVQLPWIPHSDTRSVGLWALEEVTAVCKRVLTVLQDNWDDEEEEEEVKETEVKQGEVLR